MDLEPEENKCIRCGTRKQLIPEWELEEYTDERINYRVKCRGCREVSKPADTALAAVQNWNAINPCRESTDN